MIGTGLWTLFGVGAAALVAAAVAVGKGTSGALSHVIGSRGWVEADPRTLAQAAGVPADTYALASMMVSEAGSDPVLSVAVGWAAKNRAERAGVSLVRLLTRAGHKDPTTQEWEPHESSGFFGPQNLGPRYASTRKAPIKATLDLADQVRSEDIEDPTGGATMFDAPAAQDSLVGKIAGYVKTAADVAAERSKGAELVWIPGITSTRFWRPKET